jgi:AcrR family transcriptional regulator
MMQREAPVSTHPSHSARSGAGQSLAASPVPDFPRTAPRWRRRKDFRPGEIVAAALETFVERGYAAAKLEDVARRAGVSKGTVYLYFRDKEDLFRSVVDHMVVPTVERGEAIAGGFEGTSAELFRTLLLDWWDSIRGSVLRRRRLLTRVLERGIARGEFRSVDLALAVRLAVAPILLASIWEHSLRAQDREGVDAREMVRLHVEIFLRGIARVRRAPRARTPRARARSRGRRVSARGGRS